MLIYTTWQYICIRVCMFMRVISPIKYTQGVGAGNVINKHMLTLIIDFWVVRDLNRRSMRPCRCAGAGNWISYIPAEQWETCPSSSGLCHSEQKQVKVFCSCLIMCMFLPHHRQKKDSLYTRAKVPSRPPLAQANHFIFLFLHSLLVKWKSCGIWKINPLLWWESWLPRGK